jgi:hypothetical protein
MKHSFLTLAFYLMIVHVFGQTETFDIVTYKAPKGWTKETKNNLVVFSKIDGSSWSQIMVYKNTISKGSIQKDFDSEWQELVVKNYAGISKPETEKPETAEGWTVMSGSGLWKYNDANVATILTTYSGFNACVSIVCNATATPYLEIYNDFIGSVKLYNGKETVPSNVTTSNNITPTHPKKDAYAFNVTNFDDGWTSTVQEDWVEVSKSSIKVLLHYPKEGTIFPADPDQLTNAAWNILVAPRYTNLTNYKTTYVEAFNRPYFGTGYAKENSTGKKVFVVLFRRSAGWIEIVSPDAKTFTQEFGFNPETIRWGKISDYMGGYVVDNAQGVTVKADEPEVYNKLDNMTSRNKFAVAVSDLDNTGEWNDHYSSNTFYYNYYTGNSAGMSTYSSSQWFEFKTGKKYHWRLVAANSYAGRTDVAQADGDGTFSVPNNWQIQFSEIEGKSKLYDAYFTAIKGGRILWLNDAKFPGSGIFMGFSKKVH